MTDTFIPDQTFCCTGFQHLVMATGQRGIAVRVIATPEGIRFRLQSRGIAFENQEKLRAIPDAPDIKINISCETGLLYCPACGRRLQDLVTANPKAFAELAEKYKKFGTIEDS